MAKGYGDIRFSGQCMAKHVAAIAAAGHTKDQQQYFLLPDRIPAVPSLQQMHDAILQHNELFCDYPGNSIPVRAQLLLLFCL